MVIDHMNTLNFLKVYQYIKFYQIEWIHQFIYNNLGMMCKNPPIPTLMV
jgi:hypothetical protein